MTLWLQAAATIQCVCGYSKAIRISAGDGAAAAFAYFERDGWTIETVDGKKFHRCPACKARRQAVA